MNINDELQKLVPQQINEPDQRKRLNILLTLINVDIPENLCQRIDNIILKERTPIQINIKSGVLILKEDITKLKVDAIVNAANPDMLGCFNPSHKCIDNQIHLKAGPRLRMECRRIMKKSPKLSTIAKITNGYCLPAKTIIHVAGPIYDSNINQDNLLAQCYTSSLDLAKFYNLKSIAFCCISTGIYGYPKRRAAEIAIYSVIKWLKTNNYQIFVIFCVYSDDDYALYREFIT